MKKTSLFLLGIVIGAFATYFFCPRQVGSSPGKIIKPVGLIKQETAKELNTNWTLYRKRAVDSAAEKQGRKEDDRSVWWRLNEIENYLSYSKNQADSLGYEMTGVRIYLGVYGENAGRTKKNLTTMFIVPTGKKSKSEDDTGGLGGGRDLPIPPLNDGTGSTNGYP